MVLGRFDVSTWLSTTIIGNEVTVKIEGCWLTIQKQHEGVQVHALRNGSPAQMRRSLLHLRAARIHLTCAMQFPDLRQILGNSIIHRWIILHDESLVLYYKPTWYTELQAWNTGHSLLSRNVPPTLTIQVEQCFFTFTHGNRRDFVIVDVKGTDDKVKDGLLVITSQLRADNKLTVAKCAASIREHLLHRVNVSGTQTQYRDWVETNDNMVWMGIQRNTVTIITKSHNQHAAGADARTTFETLVTRYHHIVKPEHILRDWNTGAVVPSSDYLVDHAIVYIETSGQRAVRLKASTESGVSVKLTIANGLDIKQQLNDYNFGWFTSGKYYNAKFYRSDWRIEDTDGITISMDTLSADKMYTAYAVYTPQSLMKLCNLQIQSKSVDIRRHLYKASDQKLVHLAGSSFASDPKITAGVQLTLAIRLVKAGWALPKGEALNELKRYAYTVGDGEVFGACFDTEEHASRAAKRMCTLARQLE